MADDVAPKKKYVKHIGIGAASILALLGYGPMKREYFQPDPTVTRLDRIEKKVDDFPLAVDQSKQEIIAMIRRGFDITQTQIKDSEDRRIHDDDRQERRIDALEAAIFAKKSGKNN